LVEVDLKQADGRFVAWDAAEPKLIDMYTRGVDIHRFVAAQPELFNKPLDQITKDERQLGKKAGHAANYGVMEHTLALSCLKEMDLVVSPQRARQMLEGYHRLFPGVRAWQKRIENEVKFSKRLSTPLGRERTFYDRLGPDMFREAYAYRPQSTVADVINHLVLHAFTHIPILIQIHDSCLFEVEERNLECALARIKDQKTWNPILHLLGGNLLIPIEIKIGQSWGDMKEIFSG
jgi:DNA polymerase I-like protein with 3'-5' exonuclease and polymerase domains